MNIYDYFKGFLGVAVTMSSATAALTIADMVIRITAGCIAIAVGVATLLYWQDRRKLQKDLYREKIAMWRRAGMNEKQIELLKDKKKLLDTEHVSKQDSTTL